MKPETALTRRAWLRGALTLPALGLCGNATLACGLDGSFDGGIGFIHPRAIEVALAVQKAVANGLLPTSALAPLKPDPESLWQATSALTRVGRRLSAGHMLTTTAKPNIALLVSNATLWTRYTPKSQGFDTTVHASGPAFGDVEVISELAVLTTLNEAQLTMTEALARGLLIIDTSGQKAETVTDLFTKAFANTTLSAPLHLEDRTPWRRPARN